LGEGYVEFGAVLVISAGGDGKRRAISVLVGGFMRERRMGKGQRTGIIGDWSGEMM
jgi:hypothetical protein